MTVNYETSESGDHVLLFSRRAPLNGFKEMWLWVFLWALFSSVLVHVVAAAIAFGRLRRHKLARFMPVFILIMGFVSPLTGGTVTSAAIAGVYWASGFDMNPLYSMVWGVGQTITVIFISFTRILATL